MTFSWPSALLRRIHPQPVLLYRAALGQIRVRRHYLVSAEDTVLVSYPKSGNTWLRFLLANLLLPSSPASFRDIERRIPDIYVNSDLELNSLRPPRILKSHEPYQSDYRRVVLLVRDPRDVVVSYYHYSIKIRSISEDAPIDDFVARFLAGKLDRFGSWGENVGSWLGARSDTSEFCVVRYEDMLADTESQLSRLASFLGLKPGRTDLIQAIENSSADGMRTLERAESKRWAPLKGSRQDMPFIRRARSGEWHRDLSDATANRVAHTWPGILAQLGYC